MKLNVKKRINEFPNLKSQLNEYLPLENSYSNNFDKYICQSSEAIIDRNSQFWQLSNEEENLSESLHGNLKKSFKKLIRCSFIAWLDKEKEFNDAKIILVNHGLIFPNQKSIKSIDDYSKLTSLHAVKIGCV